MEGWGWRGGGVGGGGLGGGGGGREAQVMGERGRGQRVPVAVPVSLPLPPLAKSIRPVAGPVAALIFSISLMNLVASVVTMDDTELLSDESMAYVNDFADAQIPT